MSTIRRLTATNDMANVLALSGWSWSLLPPSHHTLAAPSYKALHTLASQQVWAAVVLALLAALLVAMYSEQPRLHASVLLGCASFWALVATGLALSNPISTGIGPYVAFSLMSGWSAMRVMGGAGE